ncbi:putative reverse transcriptase zinc-binding domain-containing protein [Helianthus debilis subsp. tardiflorus]
MGLEIIICGQSVISSLHLTRVCWDFFPARASLGGVWCGIAKTLSKNKIDGIPLRNFFKGSVGKGDDIAFWLDPWVINEPLKDKFPNLFLLESEKRSKVIDRISCVVGASAGRWKWKRQAMSTQEVAELDQLCAIICSVLLSDSRDSWKWNGAADGEFSVGAVKRLLNKGRGSSENFVVKWCKWLPIKCNVSIWRAEMDRISTVVELVKRNINIANTNCPLCEFDDETVEHVFTSCFVALVVWPKISRWCKVPNIYTFSFRDLLDFHSRCGLGEKAAEALKGIIRIAYWSLWRARNGLKFNGKKVRIDDIVSEVKSVGFLWFKSRSELKNIDWDSWCKFVFM